MKWIEDIRGSAAGKTIFILGNGWSIKYFDPEKMKAHGLLLGCNMSFTKYPLDYVIWQDTKVTPDCVKAKCIKVMPVRKRSRAPVIHYDSTYFFSYGRYGRNMNDLELCNSGGLAIQFAHTLCPETIILVGCDCEIIEDRIDGGRHFHANIFRDAVVAKMKNRRSDYVKVVNGRKTTAHLQGFAKKFEDFYKRFHFKPEEERKTNRADLFNDTFIFKMGDFGIVDIPFIEWPDFYSDLHPERRSRHGSRKSGQKQRQHGIS